MTVSRDEFLAACVHDLQDFDTADAVQWQHIIYGQLGQKICGLLQLETMALGAQALSIKTSDPDALLRLATVQGKAMGFARLFDILLNPGEPEDES